MSGAEQQQAPPTPTTFTAYTLQVEELGGRCWELRRRFSDFTRLRSELAPYAGPGGLSPAWHQLSKFRSFAGSQRCAAAARGHLLQGTA